MPKYFYFLFVWLFIAIVFSAFFSGTEMAFTKVNKLRLERNSKKNKKCKKAYELSNDYPKLIGTILVGNNLVNIGASSAATLILTYFYPESGAWIASIIMTVIILIFGEILPKTIISKYSYSSALKFATPILIAEYIFYPIVFVVNKLIKLVSKIWTKKEKMPTATDEELSVMADELEEEGYIDEDTQELVKSAIDFVDVMAYEVMQPRVDIVALDVEDDVYEAFKDQNYFTYSRIPVYEDTIDHIIGYVSTNEIIKLMLKKSPINLRKMLELPIFVHKTKTISEVLRDFKRSKNHMAIVIDEFGGTLGVITLEDILEELVGDIFDETDTITKEYELKRNGSYIIDGDMNIYDMLELLDEDVEDFDSEYSTVGGWCTEMLEHFPKVNDIFIYKDLKVTIKEMQGVRCEKVQVEKIIDDNEE